MKFANRVGLVCFLSPICIAALKYIAAPEPVGWLTITLLWIVGGTLFIAGGER